MATTLREGGIRRIAAIGTLGAFALLLTCALVPVHAAIYRIGFLASLLGGWLGLLFLFWRRKPARFTFAAMPLLLAIPFLLPGRPMDATQLRNAYLQNMKSMEGTAYYWGGENSRGIDCSGLPRRALRDALLVHALQHANGDAARRFAEQWWFDTSARALGQGYRDFTVSLELGGTVAAMSYAKLRPGDLAVTTNGLHVMIYLGNEQWIQADPDRRVVAVQHGRKDESPWFQEPVTMHRWSVLQEQ